MEAVGTIAAVTNRQAALRDEELRKIASPYGLPDRKTRLAWARAHARLTCNELDKLAAVSTGYTSRAETGARFAVSAPKLAAIASALGVTIDWIMNGTAPAYVKDLPPPKPNLDSALRALNKSGRWRPETTNAARMIEGDMAASQWPSALDVIQKAIDSFRS